MFVDRQDSGRRLGPHRPSADTTIATRPGRVAAGLALLGLLLTAAATATERATSEHQLANGMKIIVQEDHRSPVVTSQIWYAIGASYERPGRTGMSHVLEHMMFKGTATHGPGELARLIAEAGGDQNAFTGSDYTAYFQTLARDRLALSFRMEADRMQHLLLDESQFQRERDVVIEERHLRVDDNPRALARELSMASAFTVNPYRQPIIGWASDLAALDLDDMREWYRRWYQPANATVVVAGDVDPGEVFALARKYFGPIPARPLEPVPVPDEPQRQGRVRLDLTVAGELTYIFLDWQVPSLASPGAAGRREVFALELLAGLLAGNDAARLPARLQRDRALAARVNASYDLYARLPTLFSLTAVPAPGRDPQALVQALLGELAGVVSSPPTEEELAMVRRQLLAERVYRNDSVFYQGLELGLLEAVGLGWRERDRYEAGINAVTAEDIAAVARRFLLDAPSTVTVAVPGADAS